jgi:hypothetical protein
MGTGTSKPPSDLRGLEEYMKQHINDVASQYVRDVLKDDYASLLDQTVCDKTVILGKDAINKLFRPVIISGNGKNIVPHQVMVADSKKLLAETGYRNTETRYIPRWWEPNHAKRLNQESVYITHAKKEECVALAEPYVKVFHLVAAVRYALVDNIDVGNFKQINSSILRDSGYGGPNNIKDQQKKVMGSSETINLRNICSTRLKKLGRLIRYDHSKNPEDITGIRMSEFEQKERNFLPDLISVLYVDSFNNGAFNKKSMEQADVQMFYSIYSGDAPKTTPPTKFSEIPLNDYSNLRMNDMTITERKFESTGKVDTKDGKSFTWIDLLREFAAHLKQAEETHVKFAMDLLRLVDMFFENPGTATNGKQMKIKQEMMELNTVNSALISARKTILQMEATCEKNFKMALLLYKQLVDHRNTLNERVSKQQTGNQEMVAENDVPVVDQPQNNPNLM